MENWKLDRKEVRKMAKIKIEKKIEKVEGGWKMRVWIKTEKDLSFSDMYIEKAILRKIGEKEWYGEAKSEGNTAFDKTIKKIQEFFDYWLWKVYS
jgi:hypothetical protein